ncbi:MAG: hypothetical protein ACYC4U_08910 [Pirellulaceae bacterium]
MRPDDPSSLTPDERRCELARIFAAGVLRLHARAALPGDTPLCGHDVCVPTQVPGWHICAFIQMDFAGNCLFCHRTRDKFRWPGGHIDGRDKITIITD